ncbi:hypothetical protein LCGC14_1901850 [marine sediment metagenome]|uniref:Uncharacterized protein n=1 Tax=marine sediment metagenome TaxID=412755 RepID=A0A0F9FWC5_9ZZZZ
MSTTKKEVKKTGSKKKKEMTKDQKLMKIAGNLTHFNKQDLVDKFLKKLSDKDIQEIFNSSEKVRASKTQRVDGKIKVKAAA